MEPGRPKEESDEGLQPRRKVGGKALGWESTVEFEELREIDSGWALEKGSLEEAYVGEDTGKIGLYLLVLPFSSTRCPSEYILPSSAPHPPLAASL